MERISVSSSQIRSIGYDSPSETLEVEFSNGAIYHYDGVSDTEHEALMNANSVGSHFYKNIRGKYTYRRI